MVADGRTRSHRASAVVEAGLDLTVVQLDLAVGACEAPGTLARVAALARVGARGLVLARLMMRAVVEVCKERISIGQTLSMIAWQGQFGMTGQSPHARTIESH
jgi:hypothetical protein